MPIAKNIKTGVEWWGEQSSSGFVCAPVTVQSAFRGNVKDKGRDGGGSRGRLGGDKGGRTEKESSSPALTDIYCVCALGVCVCVCMCSCVCVFSTL